MKLVKLALFVSFWLLGAMAAHSQGRVAFANTSLSLVRSNTTAIGGSVGPVQGAGRFRFGLYAAQGAGQPSNSLTLVALGTNSSLAGRFSGGNPIAFPTPFGAGDTVTFQVRGWTLSAGSTYEQAVSNQQSAPFGSVLAGASSLGTTVLAASPTLATRLFGSGAGQIHGFDLRLPALTLSASVAGGGSVIKNPNQSAYEYNSTVVLTAVGSPGWVFDHWSGDENGTNNPLNLTMTNNKVITASFHPLVFTNRDSGTGSLRQAIADAAVSGTALVSFATNVNGVIVLTSGPLMINTNLMIAGPGADKLVISGNNTSRVFLVTGGSVNISGLTIASGRGGINNSARLSVSNCVISGHTLSSSLAGAGIFNDTNGTLTLNNCTISSNSVTSPNGLGRGAGIFNDSVLRMTNCTISQNQIPQAFFGQGAGIYNTGTLVIVSSTVASNNLGTGNSGAGIYVAGGTASIGNSIVANNATSGIGDASGSFASIGYNFIGVTNGSSGWAASDYTGVALAPRNPLLGPLQNNGGTTLTHALLPGSGAIDKGRSFGVTADQRGRARPFDFSTIANSNGDGSDIGAFEYIPASPQLHVQIVSTNVVLSWSTNVFGFTLESIGALPSPSNTWTIAPGTARTSGDSYVITNGPTTGKRFYRLRAP